MKTIGPEMIEPELSRLVFDAFYAVYREFGPLQVRFRGQLVGDFRADIVIPGRMLIEVKAATRLVAAHEAQLLNYLRITGLPLGVILNFGPRPETRRRAN